MDTAAMDTTVPKEQLASSKDPIAIATIANVKRVMCIAEAMAKEAMVIFF